MCPRCAGTGRWAALTAVVASQTHCHYVAGPLPPFQPHPLHSIVEPIDLTLRVPAGVPDGHRIRFKGRGHHLPFHSPADVVVLLQLKPHEL